MAAAPKPVATEPSEPELLDLVRELLRELGSTHAAESLTLHSSFERDLGLGSLERVELLVRCEAHFQTRLPDEVAQRGDTPAEWLQALIEGEDKPEEGSRYRIEPPAREAPPPPDDALTMAEVLRRQAEIEPDRVQAHLLEGDAGEAITYRRLIETASAVARGLAGLGLRRDETVAIMLPTCSDFFYAFFGVMLGGGIAVPIYPPARPDKIEEYVRRQVAILKNAGVRFLISFPQAKAVTQLMRATLPEMAAVTSVDELRRLGVDAPPVVVAPSETAFIQYTSGSTGDPKGVVLSHANILANIRGIGWAVKVRPTDVVVSWLPLYHDMGLIGSWLFSVYYSLPITVFSPIAFLSRPDRWLWALHHSRGTLCPAPNFSYEMCARKIPEAALEGLDLSAWRIAINAGEAVLPETLERFAARFAPYGFHAESFVPCYGLAESSVALAFPPIARLPQIDRIRREMFETEGRAIPADASDRSSLRFVRNGRPLPGHEIRLVDEQGGLLGERLQGRVQFRGPSRTSGYYRNPQATAAVMTSDGWMDSGDLGYWAEGEICVTGRFKDIIIKAGHNIMPQEIEEAASGVQGVRKGCVAAFGVRDSASGTERVVVVAETRATSKDDLGRIENEVILRVTEAAGLPPDQVELVPPQSIPKTSSGKIRRNETRRLYESGALRATRRAPWLQIARLWIENLEVYLYLSLRRSARGLARLYSSLMLSALGYTFGTFTRLMPGLGAKSAFTRLVARAVLALGGRPVTLENAERLSRRGPAVIIANREGAFDPLLLVAALPPCLIADTAALASLPRAASFLLRPLAVPQVRKSQQPSGGMLRDRIVQALKGGYRVLVFPDSAIGAEPVLSRFRLDAFHAASSAGAPLEPVGIRGSFRSLSGREPWATRLTVGEPVVAGACELRELVALRERVRHELADLCR